MIQVEFDYPINNKLMRIVATCKSVIDGEVIEGLTLMFVDEQDNRVKVSYEKELFIELEDEATVHIADAYYNPEINFRSGSRH